jgi:hypothetical protein
MSLGPLAPTVERTRSKRRDVDTRPTPSSEIAKDRRIKPNEARLIHALLRGWRG